MARGREHGDPSREGWTDPQLAHTSQRWDASSFLCLLVAMGLATGF